MGLFSIFKREKREEEQDQHVPETQQFVANYGDTFQYRPKPNVVFQYWMPNGVLGLLAVSHELNQYDKKNKMFKCQVSVDGEDWHTICEEDRRLAYTTIEPLMTLQDCMKIANRVASGKCQTYDNEEVIGYWRVGFGPTMSKNFITCFSGRIDGNELFDSHFNDLGRITCHLETPDY